MQQQNDKKALTEYLEGFVSDRRRARLREVLEERTRHMTMVLEDVYQAHNASAVLRSCDCFGIQDVHFIENRNKYKVSEDVAMGSQQWLSISRYTKEENNTLDCLQSLKKKGYRIVATTPHFNAKDVSGFDVSKPFALVMGTELTGISKDVLDMADECVLIPMYGFTESFNISVCAALCMYDFTTQIRKKVPGYRLNETEKEDLYIEWLQASIRKSDLIMKEFGKR